MPLQIFGENRGMILQKKAGNREDEGAAGIDLERRPIVKKNLYVAVASIMVLCSACAGQGVTETDNEIVSDGCTVNEEGFKAEIGEDIAAEIEAVVEENVEETQETALKINANSANDSSVRAKITFETKEESDLAEDGKILYTSRCVYPVVEMEGNESVAEKINADIQAEVDDFLADTSIRDWAREDYEVYLSDEDLSSRYGFSGYSQDFDMTVTRNDGNVISFCIAFSSYMGGAHGLYHTIGLNFNAKTGKLLDFSDLCENEKTFHAGTLACLKELTTTNAYRSIMWSDDYDLEEILYQDEKWYFSTSGLVFFSNPYELGGFFAGNIEFTVSYAELEEMGLKEEYSYQENLTIKLQTEEICSFDLNGNGQEEKIQFYIENPGSVDTNVHFIIDGADYASENAELSGQFSDRDYLFCWTQCFLYDMDTEDDVTEIAFQMNRLNLEDDNPIPYTFFYRYEKDGMLTYLGKIKGSVTDLVVIPDFIS